MNLSMMTGLQPISRGLYTAMLCTALSFASAHEVNDSSMMLLGYAAGECDLCGGASNSNAGLGIFGQSNFIGLQYGRQSYESSSGIWTNSPTSEEQFYSYQLLAKVSISKSIALSAIVPYFDLKRRYPERKEHLSGLGDIIALAWYKIEFGKKAENEDFSVERETNHQLNIGLGIKLPTGEFENALTDRVNPDFQVGTGSVDLIGSVVYNGRWNKLGVVSSLTYYWKTENKNDYKFGNQLSGSTQLYYDLQSNGRLVFRPLLGVGGEWYEQIEQYEQELANTDGLILNGTMGLEVSLGGFVLGARYRLPFYQDLYDGDVESKGQATMYVSYLIGGQN